MVKHQQPEQKAAITKPILQQLLVTCDDSLHGVRDKAILLVGFASGIGVALHDMGIAWF
jgi:hypothetical protein